MTVTLKDIANRTGLNLSTVSRILNNPDQARASQATRERVQRVAAELGYRVNATAQALARGTTGCVGLLIPDLTDPVLMQYADLLGRGIQRMGLQMIPLQTGWRPDPERRDLAAFSRGQVDAVLSLNYRPADVELYRELTGKGIPFVFRVADLPVEDIPFDCVGIDISDAFEHLIEHLHAQGYRKIGVIGGYVADELKKGVGMTCESGLDLPCPGIAVSAIVTTARRLGLTIGPDNAIPCPENTPTVAAQTLAAVLAERAGEFDAFIVQSTKLLLGVWNALCGANLVVPERIGLTVISDSEMAQLLDVPVTVWNQPIEKICRGLLRLLEHKLTGDKAIQKIQYESGLIVRESTRGPA